MNNEIKLLKLYNGEMIIGKCSLTPTCDYNIDDPRLVNIIPTMSGSMQIAITSVCVPFRIDRLKKNIIISKSQVMFEVLESEIDNELINGYQSEISGIKLATASDMTALNSKQNSNAGQFVI